jgi:hypothetical protein
LRFALFLILYYIGLMKKNKWIMGISGNPGWVFRGFLIFMAAVFLAASCQSNPPGEAGETPNRFSLRKKNLSVLLFPEKTSGSPRMNLNLALLDAAGSGDREHFFRDLLYEGRSLSEYQDALIEGYRAAGIVGRDQNPEESGPPLDWEYAEHMDFQIYQDRWIMISREKEYYTGGAHGMREKTFYTVNLEELKNFSWKDLLTAPESPEFYHLVLEALREKDGLEKNAPLSSGIYFEDEPEIGPNFFPGPGGLVFHWNPYEIAPYSGGYQEIQIPWEKIEGLLNERGREIRSLFKPRS